MTLYDVAAISDSVALTDALIRERVLYDVVATTDSATASLIETLEIAIARSLTNKSVRIDFSAPAAITDALSATSSYVFEKITPGAIDVLPLAVRLPPGQVPPRFVTIETTEHTDGDLYSVQLTSALRGSLGQVGGGDPFSYTGIGTAPTIYLVIAFSSTIAIVIFTEPIRDNGSARNLANYSWDNGLSTVAVLAVSENQIILQTTPQTPGVLYTLTIFGELSATISDTIEMSDAGVLKLTELEDACHVADSVSYQLAAALTLSDAVTAADSAQRIVTSRRSMNDTVSATDAVARVLYRSFTVTISDSVEAVDYVINDMASESPYVAKPAASNAFDDEFDSGTADLAARSAGWTVVNANTGVTLTRSGNIDPWNATGPAGNTYWSTIIGSTICIQAAPGIQVDVYRTISLSAGDTYFVRTCGTYNFATASAGRFNEIGLYGASGAQLDNNNRIIHTVRDDPSSTAYLAFDIGRVTGGVNGGPFLTRVQLATFDIRGIRYDTGTSHFIFAVNSNGGQVITAPCTGTPAAGTLTRFAMRNLFGTSGSGVPQIWMIDYVRKKTSNAWIIP